MASGSEILIENAEGVFDELAQTNFPNSVLKVHWKTSFARIVDDNVARSFRADRSQMERAAIAAPATFKEAFLHLQGRVAAHSRRGIMVGVAGFLGLDGNSLQAVWKLEKVNETLSVFKVGLLSIDWLLEKGVFYIPGLTARRISSSIF